MSFKHNFNLKMQLSRMYEVHMSDIRNILPCQIVHIKGDIIAAKE